MKIKDKITAALADKGDLSVKELVDMLHVSKQAIHVAMSQLVEQEMVVNFGRAPQHIARLKAEKAVAVDDFNSISKTTQSYLASNFLLITEIGKIMEGIEGFSRWCKQRNLPFEKTLEEYLKTNNLNDLSTLYQRISSVQLLIGDTKGAFDSYKKFVSTKDSVFNLEKNSKLNQAAMQYEFDKKEAATKAEQEKKNIQQRLIRN